MQKFIIVMFTIFTLTLTAESYASPTSSHTTWSFGGLGVRLYRQAQDGHFLVQFNNAAGNVMTNWNNQGGVNQCPNQPTLRIHKDFPHAERLVKLIMTAGLAQKKMHVWFEATNGVCYIKSLNATM